MGHEGAVIRFARAEDVPELARLAAELGYPTSADAMQRRFELLDSSPDNAIFVAEREDHAMERRIGGLLERPAIALQGWIHVVRRLVLESGESAEILGLVVGRAVRRSGVGRRLVAAAEEWSRAEGLDRIVVRSNLVRTESHQFYPALGYAPTKSQQVYVKPLGAASG